MTSNAAERWLIYATFDPAGTARPYVVDQIRAHRAAGFDVLLVDTSPSVSEPRRRDWDREATRWMHRENRGYDFESYRQGLEHLMVHRTAFSPPLSIILANDSCFGPFFSLAAFIERFDTRPEGKGHVFGMTDSFQGGVHHLQSYWLYFRADVSGLVIEFFDGMTAAIDREEAIEFGELALGRHLIAKGCRLEAACPAAASVEALARSSGRVGSTVELIVRRLFGRWKYNRDADTQCLRHLLGFSSKIRFFNPAILLAVPLYRQGKLPFVKRSLFTQNAYRDRVVPDGLDVSTLDNEQVAALLGASARRGCFSQII